MAAKKRGTIRIWDQGGLASSKVKRIPGRKRARSFTRSVYVIRALPAETIFISILV